MVDNPRSDLVAFQKVGRLSWIGKRGSRTFGSELLSPLRPVDWRVFALGNSRARKNSSLSATLGEASRQKYFTFAVAPWPIETVRGNSHSARPSHRRAGSEMQGSRHSHLFVDALETDSPGHVLVEGDIGEPVVRERDRFSQDDLDRRRWTASQENIVKAVG